MERLEVQPYIQVFKVKEMAKIKLKFTLFVFLHAFLHLRCLLVHCIQSVENRMCISKCAFQEILGIENSVMFITICFGQISDVTFQCYPEGRLTRMTLLDSTRPMNKKS